MADQQRWFKLWFSALLDDHLQDLTPAQRWAWVAFGAFTKVYGENGRVYISPNNVTLAAVMGVTAIDLRKTIEVFPHMVVEEGQNSDGHFTVTWKNWNKYQVDSTVAQRVSRLRSKRRGEENKSKKRKELPPLTTALPPEGLDASNGKVIFQIPTGIQHALERAPRLGAVPKIRTAPFWQAQLRANPGVNFVNELLRAEAYLSAHPEKHYRRLEGFLHNWLGRADRPPMEDS